MYQALLSLVDDPYYFVLVYRVSLQVLVACGETTAKTFDS